jgi:xanthine/uracil permease
MVEFNPNVKTEDRVQTYRHPSEEAGRQRPYGAEGRLPRDDRSIFDLFREMTDEVRLLLRQEVHLARAEVMQNIKAMGRHAGYVAAGGALAYAGLLAIVGSMCAGMVVLLTWSGLTLANSLWLGPLIVGIIVAVIGYAMFRSGMNRIQKDDLVPHRTAETMRENAAWMQERVR